MKYAWMSVGSFKGSCGPKVRSFSGHEGRNGGSYENRCKPIYYDNFHLLKSSLYPVDPKSDSFCLKIRVIVFQQVGHIPCHRTHVMDISQIQTHRRSCHSRYLIHPGMERAWIRTAQKLEAMSSLTPFLVNAVGERLSHP